MLEQATARGLACTAAVQDLHPVPELGGVRVLVRPAGRAGNAWARTVVTATLEHALARATRSAPAAETQEVGR